MRLLLYAYILRIVDRLVSKKLFRLMHQNPNGNWSKTKWQSHWENCGKIAGYVSIYSSNANHSLEVFIQASALVQVDILYSASPSAAIPIDVCLSIFWNAKMLKK